MAIGGQFILLLWKNWVIQKRKPIVTVLEILLPVFFSFILIIIRQVVDAEDNQQPTEWERFQVDQLRYCMGTLCHDNTVLTLLDSLGTVLHEDVIPLHCYCVD